MTQIDDDSLRVIEVASAQHIILLHSILNGRSILATAIAR